MRYSIVQIKYDDKLTRICKYPLALQNFDYFLWNIWKQFKQTNFFYWFYSSLVFCDKMATFYLLCKSMSNVFAMQYEF